MNSGTTLTATGWFSKGWSIYVNNPVKLIGGSFILIGVYFLLGIIDLLVVSSGLFHLLELFIIIPPLIVGWFFLCLRTVRGDKVSILNLFDGFRHFGKSIATFILISIVGTSIVLFIIFPGVQLASVHKFPVIALTLMFGGLALGIVLFLKYGFSLFAVMDKSKNIFELFNYSSRITKGHKSSIFIVYLIGILLSALQVPLKYGLQNFNDDAGKFFLLLGIVPYLAYIIIVYPWINVSLAAAYSNLAEVEDAKEKTTQEAETVVKTEEETKPELNQVTRKGIIEGINDGINEVPPDMF